MVAVPFRLILVTTKAMTNISAITPTTPPAIAAITFGELFGIVCGKFGLAGASTSASPTPNVEKCVTTNVHMHWPLCREPMQRDISSGDEEGFPALASDTANPCEKHHDNSKLLDAHLHLPTYLMSY